MQAKSSYKKCIFQTNHAIIFPSLSSIPGSLVVVYFENNRTILECDQQTTISTLRSRWHDKIGHDTSVAFFTPEKQYLSDEMTVREALDNSTFFTLELHAYQKSSYGLRVYGFEDTYTRFEVADVLTPSAVRREIERAVDIHTDDFRLTWSDEEVNQDLAFKEQDFASGALLTLDLEVVVNVTFEDSSNQITSEPAKVKCFSSETIGGLRQKLSLDDDTVLVATSPYRRILPENLLLCDLADELIALEIPIALTAERKTMVTFEPVSLDKLRQDISVALSCAPIDLNSLIRERFKIKTHFRLTNNGDVLDDFEPLRNQLFGENDIIEIDILRHCKVFDLWESNSFEEVLLYSTEHASELYLKNEISNQRLFFEGIHLATSGSMNEIFGPSSGRNKTVLVIDRDVERSLPMQTFEGIMNRPCWARSLLINVVPLCGGLMPKEVMHNERLLRGKRMLSDLRLNEESLLIMDPKRVLIESEKKLRIHRFAHGSIYSDIRERIQQRESNLDIGLKTAGNQQITDEMMSRKIDLETLMLTNATRLQTKLSVTVNNRWYSCCFAPRQVSFSDVMADIGKQAKVIPRHLSRRSLYCCGCGRQLSMEEEPHQTIPAACCSVKSLRLTDRQTRGERSLGE